ncbi:MAG: amidohydrolase family protein [Planctomycetota bacterium]|nr:amidohydrolase family protein [Planctomycetota bacterium]
MLIDSHQHVFWHGRDDAGLVADLDENGVDLAWLLSWDIPREDDSPGYHSVLNPIHARGDGTHPGIPLTDLLTARRNYPKRFVVGYCPHPAQGDAPALFESAVRIHNVRICGEWKFRILFDDPRSLNLFRAAGRLKCPVVLHLDVPYLPDAKGNMVFQSMWYGGTVANLERALQACPETIFIGHAPGFWREISGDADAQGGSYPTGPVTPGGRLYPLFEKYPNLYADLSAGSALRAISRDPAHGKRFLEKFADRLLFGRDYYGNELATFLKTCDLPADVWAKISHQNALKLVPM